MKERAQLIGARFEIQSERQRGTQVDIWAPVAKQACPKADGVAAQSAVSGA